MEANENTTPEFEQQIEDTRNELQNDDQSFERGMGLPLSEPTAPPAPSATSQQVAHPPVQQDFSANEVAPNPGNDEVRYEYWQSQAAKLQNQLNEVKEYAPMVDYLRNNPEAVQSITPGGQPPAQTAETPSQEAEEFPPPPAKPEQPRGFSREEAISDPASDSAVHLDEVEKWRDDMMTYNQLASQYQIATMRETYNHKLEGLEKVELERKQAEANHQEMNEVRSYVSQKYNLGPDLDNFINTMNDPASINMDDLVGYYQYKQGKQVRQPVAQQPQRPPVQRQPSAAFKQTQRAQSVPTPMGVQPAAQNQPQSESTDFMDTLINDNNKQNIL
jgi:hypothetical protein